MYQLGTDGKNYYVTNDRMRRVSPVYTNISRAVAAVRRFNITARLLAQCVRS